MDDFLVQVAACKAGLGAILLPQILHRYAGLRELENLQELDIDLGPGAIGNLFLVCHRRLRHLPKVQLVMDFIFREFDSVREPAENRPINPPPVA